MGATAAVAGYEAFKGKQEQHKSENEARRLKQMANRTYEELGGYLPPAFRHERTGPIIGAGIEGIGNLIRNPGRLETQVGSADAPGVAMESQDIAQQYRNQAGNEAGAAGAQNLPASVRALLQQVSGTGQEKAQRGARTRGLGNTAKRKRADLGQTYQLLNTILQFISTGRGQAIPGLVQRAQQGFESGQTNSAASMAALGSLLQSMGQKPAAPTSARV